MARTHRAQSRRVVSRVRRQAGREIVSRAERARTHLVMNGRPIVEAINAALIGYSLGGRYFHAPFIATTPGMRLGVIVTSDAERQRQARAEHPDARIIATTDELFADPRGIDLVVISTPN